MTDLTDAAVEAADRAYYAEPDGFTLMSRKSQMRAALIAALPHLKGEPSVVRNDTAGFYEVVVADVPTLSKPVEARSVEALHAVYGDRGLVGFRVWDSSHV